MAVANSSSAAGGGNIRRNVFRHDGTGADNTPRADLNTREEKGARADERVFADRDLGRDELEGRMREIVAPGAQINLLRHSRALPYFDFAEAVGIRPIAETGAIPQG